MNETEHRQRERLLYIVLLSFGIVILLCVGQVAIGIAPNWEVAANMRSNLDPNSDFLTRKNSGIVEPLNPDILTLPAWLATPNATLPINAGITPVTQAPTRAPTQPATLQPTVANTFPATASTIYVPPPTKPGNKTSTPTNIPIPSANLAITKTDGSTTYIPGGGISYQIVVTNGGPNNASGFRTTDAVPAVINITSVSCAPSGTASCGTNGSSGNNVSFTGISVNAGAGNRITITVNGTVNVGATGNLINTANIVIPGGAGFNDPNTSNNTATDTSILVTDLSVTKSDGATTYVIGGTTVYTVTVSNNSATGVTGAVISDGIPPQVISWTWVCTNQLGGANGCDPAGATNTNFSDTVNLPAGSSIVYTVTANISGTASGNLVNTATVSPPAGYTDSVPGNNSSTDTDTPTFAVDLSITKDDGTTTYTAGGVATYIVTVTNVSTTNVNNVFINDNKPSQVVTWNWACTAQNGGASGCIPVTNSIANFTNTVNLPASSSIVYTVTANISGTAIGELVNTAAVSLPAGYTDLVPGNNSSTDTDTPIYAVDLSITKNDSATTYTPGGMLTYTIVVTNNSAFMVNGALVTDSFPAQISSANWTCAGVGGATCTASGSGNINDTVNLPAGLNVTYTVTANVSASAAGTLTNTASVAVPAGFTDTDLSNNSATDNPADTSSTPSEPNIGPPDTSWIGLPTGSSETIVFSPAIIANGDIGTPDLVYYEVVISPETTVYLDWVQIEISPDGITWVQVFNWGAPPSDVNTNVDLGLIGDVCPTEIDNCGIPIGRLYNSTGITIDIDSIAPLGNYPWIRITSPPGGTDGADIDAIQPYYP